MRNRRDMWNVPPSEKVTLMKQNAPAQPLFQNRTQRKTMSLTTQTQRGPRPSRYYFKSLLNTVFLERKNVTTSNF